MALLPRLNPFITNIRQVSLSSCFLKTAPSQGELPKRPTTPWTSYYTANYPGVKEKYPNLPTPEIMRLISGNWKKLPDTEKDRLQKIYHDEKRQYLAKLDQLPEGTLQRAKEMKREKKEIKKEKKDKKEAELVKKLEKKERSEAASELRKLEENKPKRNLNSYLLYANDRRSNLPSSMEAKEMMKIVALEWKNLSSDLKLKYEKKASLDKERYNQEMDSWKEKMGDGTMAQITKLKKIVKNKS